MTTVAPGGWHSRKPAASVGTRSVAHPYADSARIAFEEQLRASPDDAQLHVLLGLALAYLGKKAEAIREGERGVTLLPLEKDGLNAPYIQHQLVRIYILVGEPEKAIDRLEPLLKIPYNLSPGVAQDRSVLRSAAKESAVPEARWTGVS